MADLSALTPLVRELKAAGYSDAEIPGIIRALHDRFIAPQTQTTQMNVAGGYGLLSPMIDMARTALAGYEAALRARMEPLSPIANVLATLLSVQQNPFAIIPALATYGELGGTPNQAAAFLLARQGQASPPIYGTIVDQLIQEFLKIARDRPKIPRFDPSAWTMAPQNAQPSTQLTPEQERLIREAYARDPIAAERFFYEASRNPEGVRRIIQKAEEDRRRVQEAYARDPVAAARFFEEAARNPEGVRRMFGTFAKGGTLVLDEPVLGIGLRSRQPRFLAGEEGPEEMAIKPIEEPRKLRPRPPVPPPRLDELRRLLPSPLVPLRPFLTPRQPILFPPPVPLPLPTTEPVPKRPIVFPFPRRIPGFAHGGSVVSLPAGWSLEGGRLRYKDPMSGVAAVMGGDVAKDPVKLQKVISRTMRTIEALRNTKRFFSPATARVLRALGAALNAQGGLPTQDSEPPPADAAPPPAATPAEPPPAAEPPHVAAARLLAGALRGHTMFAPGFIGALEQGQLPTILPSVTAFATLSPVLREALLGYLTQASGGALTREQILGSIMQGAPAGWGF